MVAAGGLFAALALAGGAAAQTADAASADASAPDAPADPFEQGVIYLEADTLTDDRENGRYVARGNVEIRTGDRVIRGDEIVYYPEEARLTAQGNLTIIEADGTVEFAERADLSDDLEDGVVLDFSIRLANEAVAAAAYVERRGGTQNIMTRAVYTACPVCAEDPTPTWRMRARKALQDTEAEMIYYRDFRFEVAGVPVLYSPFFAHADPSVGRKSGFLIPGGGYSTITGWRVQQPYFWAIDRSQDLTLTPMVMSEVAPALLYEYRKRFYSGYVSFEGSVTKEQLFNSEGDKFGNDKLRGSLFGSGVFALTEDWAWGFGVERVTDDQYMQRYNIDFGDTVRGLYGSTSLRLLNQLFVVGQDDDFYSSVTVGDFQSLRGGELDGTLPKLLPIAEYRRLFDLDDYGRAELVSDVTMLQRTFGQDYLRGSVWADWQARRVADFGLVMEPFARARADYYHVWEAYDPVTGLEAEGGEERVSAYGGVDVRYPFYRPGAISLTIEPRAQLVYSVGDSVPLDDYAGLGPGDTLIPLREESEIVELNGTNLFSPDKFTGLDRLEDGFRANYGVQATADWGTGHQARLLVGQSYHSDTSQFSPYSGLSTSASDYVVEAELQSQLTSFASANVASRLRIDEDDYSVERGEVEAALSVSRITAAGEYLYLSQDFSGGAQVQFLTGVASLQITDNIWVSYGARWDLEAGTTRQKSYGLTYSDDCLTLSLTFADQNISDRAIQPHQSITVRLSLKTLGAFGTN